jgi:hypothetical protein
VRKGAQASGRLVGTDRPVLTQGQVTCQRADLRPLEPGIDIADPHAPMGAHGIGEIGITGVGAVVANAVYNAAGTRVRPGRDP